MNRRPDFELATKDMTMTSTLSSAFRTGAFLALALAALVLSRGAAGQAPREPSRQPPSAAQVESRLKSLKVLVETSTAARQIDSSGNPRAIAQRIEARQLVRLAAEAHAAGDERSAATLLDGAARQMLEGARLAAGEQVHGANLEREIGARIESVQALLAAQKRISAEKSVEAGAGAARQIEELLGQARTLHAAKRFTEAQPIAQKAYLLAKASIGSMRGGDTLVRTLSFASKEEEYHYEVDRYETHRMLLDLLAKKPGTQDATGQAFVARAEQLRREADANARRGDHASAVNGLEDATRELVRAIRAAGVFIPG